jgi:hypothetical protein
MLHYGDPDWYEQYVGPLRAAYRKDDKPQVRPRSSLSCPFSELIATPETPAAHSQIEPPQTTSELKQELSRLREERLAKRAERLGLSAEARTV